MATNQFGIRNSEFVRRLERPMVVGRSGVVVGSRIGMTQTVSHHGRGTGIYRKVLGGHTVKDFGF